MYFNVPFFNAQGINNPGQQFFIYLWLELFNKLTLDTYRFRAMNSKSIVFELREVMNYVEKGIWDPVNIKLVCKEAIRLIENDKVLIKYHYFGGLKKLVGSAITSNENEDSLKSMLNGVLAHLDKCYLKDLTEGLKQSIDSNDIGIIEWYTKTLSSELINLGYDRGFLEFKIKDIFFDGSPKTFNEKFDIFVQQINPVKSPYESFLKLYPNNPKIFPDSLLGFEFVKEIEGEFDEQITRFISAADPKIFAKSVVEAVDPFSAAIVSRSKLGNALDLIYYAVQDSNRINIDDQCLIINEGTPGLFDSRPSLVGYIPSSVEWLPKIESQLSKIIGLSNISTASKDKLKGALRYFRLSREAINIEHQFLNLWIALEHIVRTGAKHKSIIEPISSYVPKTLSLYYVNRIIRDVLEHIKRSKIQVPRNIRPYLDRHNIHKFIELTRDATLFQQLIGVNNIDPLLIHRLNTLKNTLSTSQNIKKAIEKNCFDIDLHLARMYRFRNQIVHHAAHDLNISGITANLLSYLRDILNKLLYELSTYESLSDLNDVYLKYKTTYEQYMFVLDQDTNNQVDLKLLVKPLRVIWP